MADATGAREDVLERIRAALADAPAAGPIPRAYETTLAPAADIVELFADRVSDYQATVHHATTETIADVVAAVLAGHGARRVVVPAGVPRAWLSATDAVAVGDDPPLTWPELDVIDGVITGSAVSIAETGTIVLDAGPDQGRRALTLLPDLHVCVVHVDGIVGTVSEALTRLDPTRPLTWISGPSATSDIELQRVEGVHGPRRLDVIVLRD